MERVENCNKIPIRVPLKFRLINEKKILYGHFNGLSFIPGITNPRMLPPRTLSSALKSLPTIYWNHVFEFEELPTEQESAQIGQNAK